MDLIHRAVPAENREFDKRNPEDGGPGAAAACPKRGGVQTRFLIFWGETEEIMIILVYVLVSFAPGPGRGLRVQSPQTRSVGAKIRRTEAKIP